MESDPPQKNSIKLSKKEKLAKVQVELMVFQECMFVSPLLQIQQVAGRHLSQPQRYRQGPEGFGGDVIRAGAHGQQPVQQRRP